MHKLTRSNLQDFCRTCLRSLRTTISSTTTTTKPSCTLFGYSLNQWPDLLELVLMLNDSINDVREHVAFPRSLCQLCYDKLVDIKAFQKVVLHTTNKLHDILKNEINATDIDNTLRRIQNDSTVIDAPGADYEDDDNKLLLPELAPLLAHQIKTEQIEIEETQLQDKSVFSVQQQDEVEITPAQVKIENKTDEDTYLQSNSNEHNNNNSSIQCVDGDSFDEDDDDNADEAQADDADDEEHALRNGAANTSSFTTPNTVQFRKRDRNKKSLQCPRCEKHAYKKVYLEAHIRAVHEGYDKPFLCESCQKAFTRYQQLREHIQSIHELKEKIICTFNGCNTTFTTQNLLQSHFKIIHDIEETGQFALGLQKMLEIHSTTQLSDDSIQNMCFQCERPYSSRRALSEHLKRHAKIKEHVCEVCGVAKVTRTELITHLRTHEPNAEKFKCSMCPQQFNHKNAITRHIRVVHEGQRRFLCRFCPKRFGTRNSQMCHERLHTGERPFSCNRCEKTFAQSEALKSHEKKHDINLRKHICSYCSKRFITLKNLKDHERRHEGDKPFICSICNRGFCNAVDLNMHNKHHTDEERQILKQQQPQQPEEDNMTQ